MAVRIAEIRVRGLGPLGEFATRLSRLNLFYGHNERGKTFLVEFLIRSLFRTARQWSLRGHGGDGVVVIEGLEKKPVEFSPAKKRKLDDYWGDNTAFPPDFSRLLVVKGAEVELANVAGGIDKAALKRLLPYRYVLEQIQKSISKTVQESRLERGAILGPRRGEINTRHEIENRLGRAEQLLKRINVEYTTGPVQGLLEKRKDVRRQIEVQEAAKAHLAYQLNGELDELKGDRVLARADKLPEIRSQLTLYKQLKESCKRNQERIDEAQDQSRHVIWLKKAQELYQNAIMQRPPSVSPLFLLASAFALLAAATFLYLQRPQLTAMALAALAIFASLHFWFQHRATQVTNLSREHESLRREFEERFGKELTGLPVLLELREQQETAAATARLLAEQLNDDRTRLQSMATAISDLLFEITGEQITAAAWDEVVRNLEEEVRVLERRIRSREIALAELNVPPESYREEGPEQSYSKPRLQMLFREEKNYEEKIQQEQGKLDNLKQAACQVSEDEINARWETIIQNLLAKRHALQEELRTLTANLAGKIAVSQVLQQMRMEETERLKSVLQSPPLTQTLQNITGRYNRIELQDDRLVISDQFSTFPLSDLSTGALEQVLLALRMGLSAHLHGDALFLVLDDAFQYSDWERRKLLVDQVTEIANSGWQILYFTMDDNIRELFEKAGSTMKKDFQMIEL